ncbi:hypothetical protein GCM10009108_19970 [Castellaniella ginsengisoli]|uniref:Uncharacterized protein n=1 Tax=Castellaniella ginsengisoli TaxID=546114 RepID=A0ABN1KZY7_9BURK
MGFDRALRDPEFYGNVFIGPPPRQVGGHFPLAQRQAAQRRFLAAGTFPDRIAFQHGWLPRFWFVFRGILHDPARLRTCQF